MIVGASRGRRSTSFARHGSGAKPRLGAEFTLAVQHATQVGQGYRGVRVIRTQRFFQDAMRAPQQQLGTGEIAATLERQGQVVQGRGRIGAVRPGTLFINRQRAAQFCFRGAVLALAQQRGAKASVTHRSVGMVVTEYAQSLGHQLARHTLCLRKIPLAQQCIRLVGKLVPAPVIDTLLLFRVRFRLGFRLGCSRRRPWRRCRGLCWRRQRHAKQKYRSQSLVTDEGMNLHRLALISTTIEIKNREPRTEPRSGDDAAPGPRRQAREN